ncbi:MAG: DUF3990 domain-containing protein [Solobacterium sp.]|nr:DUF3990 domain-containing protein [Solobacterium sp.]
MNYDFKKDVDFIFTVSGNDLTSLAEKIGISKRTLLYALEGNPSPQVLEKTYSYIYKSGYVLSEAKNELFLESLTGNEKLFYHGSRYGIDQITADGSRLTSDFSRGFYCSESLGAAVSFVEEYQSSSVYAFKADLSGLKTFEFDCDLDWMLAISYFRHKLSNYQSHKYISSILDKLSGKDVIIAPIVDNKMFEILNQFSNGEITSVQALHSLSASRLGKQYVFKTSKAINSLIFLDRYYLCDEERSHSILSSIDRNKIIQTKLDLAKREYRGKGKYIDEILK